LEELSRSFGDCGGGRGFSSAGGCDESRRDPDGGSYVDGLGNIIPFSDAVDLLSLMVMVVVFMSEGLCDGGGSQERRQCECC